MKKNIIALVLMTVLVTFAVVASAAISVNPISLSGSTLPSDDANTRTITLGFNLTSDVNENIQISVTGIDSFSPSLSQTTDSLTATITKFYTLTLTAPKYQSGTFNGNIVVKNSSGSQIGNSGVSITLTNHNSLIFVPSTAFLTKNSNTVNMTLKNDGNQLINGITASLANGTIVDVEDEELAITLSPSGTFSLNPGQSMNLSISYTEDPENIDLILGDSSTLIRAVSSAFTVSGTVKFRNDFCENGEIGNDVDIISVEDESADSDNFDWELLQDVEVQVEVANDGDSDEDVTVELILYDPSNGDELFTDEQTIVIDEDDEDTFTFNFVVPADTPEDARLYVKAYYDGNEDEQCSNSWGSSTFEEISIEDKEEFDVGVTDIEVESTLMCGESTVVTAELHNIGDEDQDRILLSLTNDELGIDQDIEVTNLDSGDSESVSFSIEIPLDAAEKIYQLEFQARHDYNNRNDNYNELSDKTLKSFRVEGNCAPTGSAGGDITISPTLESEAMSGKDMIVNTILTNNGRDSVTVSVIPFGYESWASLSSVEPSSVTIGSGQSKEVQITMVPNSGASGDQTFTIRASYGSKIVDQQVSVFVKSSSSKLLQSIKDNWVIWMIIIANVILIVAIVIAAVKLSRD